MQVSATPSKASAAPLLRPNSPRSYPSLSGLSCTSALLTLGTSEVFTSSSSPPIPTKNPPKSFAAINYPLPPGPPVFNPLNTLSLFLPPKPTTAFFPRRPLKNRKLVASIRNHIHSPHTESTRTIANLVPLPLDLHLALGIEARGAPIAVIGAGLARWLEIYSCVLLIRVLLSWFPNIPWEQQPMAAVRDLCEPYLSLFRGIIPPLFNVLDVSPILAFLLLGMLGQLARPGR